MCVFSLCLAICASAPILVIAHLIDVVPGGWDNRSFRLGDELLMRVPSAEGYVAAVAKEQRWLPVIGPSRTAEEEDVWVRGRGWAPWKAMLLLTASAGSDDPELRREAPVS